MLVILVALFYTNLTECQAHQYRGLQYTDSAPGLKPPVGVACGRRPDGPAGPWVLLKEPVGSL